MNWEYPPRDNHAPPPGGEFFQRELNRIAGFVDSGQPRVRLVWGQAPHGLPFSSTYYARDGLKSLEDDPGGYYLTYPHERFWEPQLVEYQRDLAGKISGAIWHPKNTVLTKPLDVKLRRVEIGQPFWFLEETRFVERKDWESDGGYTIGQGGDVTEHGPLPTGGVYYEQLWKVGYHRRGKCECGKGLTNYFLCDGLYRQPDWRDLQELARRMALRAEEQKVGDREPIPQHILEQAIRDKRDAQRDYEARRRTFWTEEYRKSAGWVSDARILDEGGPGDQSKYHVLGLKKPQHIKRGDQT